MSDRVAGQCIVTPALPVRRCDGLFMAGFQQEFYGLGGADGAVASDTLLNGHALSLCV
ncbi:MAG: hypothetical protein LRY66_05860 [Saccharospirillaceae bacterium]|nr:hypothetical protein [Saccharospirillaceae bacterium]MCD8530880.1 hypothetical protein [Saccharospirillaceae bacterium]